MEEIKKIIISCDNKVLHLNSFFRLCKLHPHLNSVNINGPLAYFTVGLKDVPMWEDEKPKPNILVAYNIFSMIWVATKNIEWAGWLIKKCFHESSTFFESQIGGEKVKFIRIIDEKGPWWSPIKQYIKARMPTLLECEHVRKGEEDRTRQSQIELAFRGCKELENE